MSDLTLLVLRIGFLLLLWVFVFAIVYALRTDLFGQKVRRMPAESQPAASPFPAAAPVASAPQPTPAPAPAAQAGSNSAKRLVITSGAKEGLEIALSDQPLTIGRSSESGLVIRDDYTSTHHARLMLWGDDWVIQDLDSTNGTYLAGQRVTVPTPVPLNTPVKIGTTSFELRR
ncbi:FHA domain-containing protein [Cryobacterium sp. BB736]|uniref:FHA domain-containing protein FhaB/FipA n=1 Tax=Cryobacterium sp. BB736 TaxID=2746963 RepID=UPI001876CD16|nr:FHA domain-containing protein [Cryobacterium sp. BB736]